MTRSTILIAMCLVASLLVSGCMNRPRNGFELPNPAANFDFSGFVVNPNETIDLRVKDQSSGAWTTHWNTTTSDLAYPDGTLTWFEFRAMPRLRYGSSSFNRRHWRMGSNVGSQRRMAADLMGRSPTRGDLVTFELDADGCQQSQTDGLGIANNCRSPSSPVATVFAKCGKPDQACCFATGFGAGDNCDHGRNCNMTTSTCSIPSGEYLQPCNADGTCNNPDVLACGDRGNGQQTCRSLVENTPIFSTELVVHTCNQADAPTKSPLVISLNPWHGNDGGSMLDHPGTDTARNRDDTWGLVVPRIRRISDMEEVSLSLTGTYQQQSDGWCVDRVDLVVNGVRILSKSYSTPQWLDSDSNSTRLFVWSYDELRAAFSALDPGPLCALPTGMTMVQIRRAVEGIMGDLFAMSSLEVDDVLPNATRFDAWWGSGGVTLTRLNANTIGIGLRFRAREESVGDFEGDVTAQLEMHVGCDWALIEGHSAGNGYVIDSCSNDFYTDLVLKYVDFDADSLLDELGGFISAIGTRSLASILLKNMGTVTSYDGMFRHAESLVCPLTTPQLPICDVETGDTDGDVCGCPIVTVDSTGVKFNWSNFGYQHWDLNALLPMYITNPICH